MNMAVVQPETQQLPREKLQAHGVENLNMAELLAIVFNTGLSGKNPVKVWDLADRLLQEYGHIGLRDVRTYDEVREATGLPKVKACQLLAVMELGRRLYGDAGKHTSQRAIHTPEDVKNRVADMCQLRKEQLRGLYLNARNHVIHEEAISLGTITANLVDPGDVFRPALHYAAIAVIVVHNHPSGDPSPSDEDLAITSQLVEAGKLLGITLLDHVIVAGNNFVSLSDYGAV